VVNLDLYYKEWDESKHPRDPKGTPVSDPHGGGRFTSSSGGERENIDRILAKVRSYLGKDSEEEIGPWASAMNWKNSTNSFIYARAVKRIKSGEVIDLEDRDSARDYGRAATLLKLSSKKISDPPKFVERLIGPRDSLIGVKPGQVVDLSLVSFTRAKFSKGEAAGIIYVDEEHPELSLVRFLNPDRGFDVDAFLKNHPFAVQGEKEIILTGNAVVKSVKKEIIPGHYRRFKINVITLARP
jgi:hypothetical protein